MPACLPAMPDPDKSSESESESEKDMDIDDVTVTKVLPRDTKSTLQCVLALGLVLDVVKSAKSFLEEKSNPCGGISLRHSARKINLRGQAMSRAAWRRSTTFSR